MACAGNAYFVKLARDPVSGDGIEKVLDVGSSKKRVAAVTMEGSYMPTLSKMKILIGKNDSLFDERLYFGSDFSSRRIRNKDGFSLGVDIRKFEILEVYGHS
jgi:hypothetical protein